VFEVELLETRLPRLAQSGTGQHAHADDISGTAIFRSIKGCGKGCGKAGDFLCRCQLLGALSTNPYWARNWLLFGREVQPIVGAVLVFSRGSGGHVGFVIGQDEAHCYVLGGNQSDAVTVARIAKSRLLGVRWPATYPPRLQRLPTMKPGEFLSTANEI
jgi:hypothetical protein